MSSRLGDLVRRASVRILFMRHGETKPGAIRDWDRELSAAGKAHAVHAGESFGRALGPYCRIAMASPAPRCLETVNNYFTAVDDAYTLRTSQELYDGTIRPGPDQVFARLGYQPLSTYYKDGGATTALDDYAHLVVDEIIQLLDSDDIQPLTQKDQYQTLVFCSHAIYLPAAGKLCAQLLGAPKHALRLLTDLNMRPCEAFLLVPSLPNSSGSNNSTAQSCQVRLFGFDDEEHNDTFNR